MYSFQNGETDRIAGAVLLQNPPVELMCKLCSELSQKLPEEMFCRSNFALYDEANFCRRVQAMF
jgi:hypothetical protein